MQGTRLVRTHSSRFLSSAFAFLPPPLGRLLRLCAPLLGSQKSNSTHDFRQEFAAVFRIEKLRFARIVQRQEEISLVLVFCGRLLLVSLGLLPSPGLDCLQGSGAFLFGTQFIPPGFSSRAGYSANLLSDRKRRELLPYPPNVRLYGLRQEFLFGYARLVCVSLKLSIKRVRQPAPKGCTALCWFRHGLYFLTLVADKSLLLIGPLQNIGTRYKVTCTT